MRHSERPFSSKCIDCMFIDGIVTPLIEQELQPNIPKLNNLYNPVFQQAFGQPDKAAAQELKDLQEKLAADPASKNAKKWQNKIDKLMENDSTRMDKSYAQQQLNTLQDWFPKFNEFAMAQQNAVIPQQIAQQGQFGQQLGQAYQDAQKSLAPEFFANRTAMGQQLGQDLGQGLNPQQIQFFRNQMANEQAARGMYDSPLSSVNSSLALTGLDLDKQQQNIGNMQNYLNTYQMPFIPTVIQPTGSPGQGLWGEMFTPLSQQELFNTNVGLQGAKFARQQGFANSMAHGIVDSFNNVASLAMGGMGGGMGGMMGGMGGGGAGGAAAGGMGGIGGGSGGGMMGMLGGLFGGG